MLARVAAAQNRVPASIDAGPHHDPNVSRYGQQQGQGPGLQAGGGTDQSGRQPPPGGGAQPRRTQRNLANLTTTSMGGTSVNSPSFTAPSSVAPRQNLVGGASGGALVSAPGAVSQVSARTLQSSTSSSLGNYGSTWGRGGRGAGGRWLASRTESGSQRQAADDSWQPERAYAAESGSATLPATS